MNKLVMFKAQKYLVYVLITIAIILAIGGLGFMTNYYPLFYDGTSDMYDYYKSLQGLNKAMFKAATVFIIMAFLYIGFDLNKEKNGWFGIIYTVIVSVYVTLSSISIISAIPFFQKKYEAFDFTPMTGYVPSSLMFTVQNILFIVMMVVSIVLTLIILIRFIKTLSKKEEV